MEQNGPLTEKLSASVSTALANPAFMCPILVETPFLTESHRARIDFSSCIPADAQQEASRDGAAGQDSAYGAITVNNVRVANW